MRSFKLNDGLSFRRVIKLVSKECVEFITKHISI